MRKVSRYSLLLVALTLLCKRSESVTLAYKQDFEWLQWKSQHEKSYEDDINELERYVTWQSNRAFIQAHNELQENFGYTVEMNQFGDMVSECTLIHI